MTSTDSSYDTTLAELARSLPRLAAALQQVEQNRAERTARLVGGARFKGLDELLRHLDELLQAFIADPTLCRIAFLIDRSRADVETATEATLSGYVAAALDTMRDVMEIETLLLDFAFNPAHIDEWLTADRKTLLAKFAPARVRNRLHAAGQRPYTTTSESVDYQGHSIDLHVNPQQGHTPVRGFSAEHAWHGDIGFWEIFEHTRRLLHTIRRLTGALASGSAVDQLANRELSDVQEAWERTQDMQTIHLALVEATMKTQTEEQENA